jgi:hypothetical protein
VTSLTYLLHSLTYFTCTSSPDARHPQRTTPTGIYKAGCGLDSTLCAFGHDEYMYQVLAQSEGVTLPKEALSVVRHLPRVITRSTVHASSHP